MADSEGQDWASYQAYAPSTTGLAFVFIKATEGVSYTNPRYASQIATARNHSLVVGHYHFARPTASMTVQADYFLARSSLKKGDPIALDWEDKGVSTAEKDQWIRYVQSKAPGHKVGLYCNKDFWLNRDSTGFYGDFLWIADPDNPRGQPGIRAEWLFHQYSEAGGIDRNYCPLTPAALHAWATGTTPTPQETDVNLSDKATAKAGAWTDKDQTFTVEQWLTIGNLKAGRAVELAAKALAGITAANAAIATLASHLGQDVDTDTVVAAVQKAIADAVVHVQVDVTGADPTA